MTAISLWQPWADAMRLGLKTSETRSWSTNYRGDLLICSAKRKLDQVGLAIARENNIPLTGMKFGFALCIVELFQVSRSDDVRMPLAETGLGDYSAGRFVWNTRNLRVIEPFHVIGRQSFWNQEIPI